MRSLKINRVGLIVFFILLTSIPIFHHSVYRFLINYIDRGWAYVIDQFLPLVVTNIIAFLVIKKNIPAIVIKKYIFTNWKPICFIVITLLVIHVWTLGNYFLGEGWGFIRLISEPSMARQSDSGMGTNLSLHPIEGVFRGWHNGVMTLTYELFWNRAELYNATNLILYTFTAIVTYIFFKLLLRKRTAPALVGTLFFIMTPAYLDMFARTGNPAGMPIALSDGILSLIFLILWQKKQEYHYYILSLLFYFIARISKNYARKGVIVYCNVKF